VLLSFVVPGLKSAQLLANPACAAAPRVGVGRPQLAASPGPFLPRCPNEGIG
jgi:hypothetical protein